MIEEGNTKIVICYYCQKEFEVAKKCSTTKSYCLECKKEGKKSPFITKDIVEKRKNTCFSKYGKEYPTQCNEVKEKSKETCLTKYGYENPFQNPDIREKAKNTILKKYGENHQMKCEDLRTKTKLTCLQKYGSESPLGSKPLIEKRKQTMLNSYGVEYSFQNSYLLSKSKEICLTKYGYENPFQNPDVREKYKKTCLTKYGYENPFQNPDIIKLIKKDRQKKTDVKFQRILNHLDLEAIEKYIDGYTPIKIKCKLCNTIFTQTYFNLCQGSLCPKCHPKVSGYSYIEKDILCFVKSILFENTQIYTNTRSIISPKELDIYIPNKQVVIEFNGLYWYSEEAGIDPNYHLSKTKKCNELGIRLIHIFEDEWLVKQEIVKARLKQILNVQDSIRIHARQCEIKEIDSKTKNEFLNQYHIQGKDTCSIKLGAFYKNELVSIMTFSKPNISKGSNPSLENVWELNRFCSNFNYHIPGIASKLLFYFKTNYKWKEIYSYADRRWSDGNLYYKLGFKLDHITQPNYWYVKDMKRIHRFNLRKKESESKDIPEYILRSQQGYNRIWDCGSLKFIMVNIYGDQLNG